MNEEKLVQKFLQKGIFFLGKWKYLQKQNSMNGWQFLQNFQFRENVKIYFLGNTIRNFCKN